MRLRFAVLAIMAATQFIPATNALAAAPETAAQLAESAPIAPERLAAARITANAVFPAGTYARMMNGTMDKMMDSIMNSMAKMPLKELAGVGGASEATLAKMSNATMQQIMDIYDPAYRQRTQILTHTMMNEMVTLMTGFEPQIRDGLAQAYARRFDAAQLAQLNAFFATPTGKAYATDSNLMMTSPEVMSTMADIMPALMKQMPAIIEKVKTASADLPPVRTFAQLSDSDKTKLAGLLGVSREELDKSEAAKVKARAHD